MHRGEQQHGHEPERAQQIHEDIVGVQIHHQLQDDESSFDMTAGSE